jgi:hypothetical protein
MAPVEQVFGGERQTPHAIFQQSRAESGWTSERPDGNASANHAAVDLAIACPSCAAAGNPNVRMFSRAGAGYYCVGGGHKWMDFDQLMGLNPQKMEYRGRKTIQANYRKVEVEVPSEVAEAFLAKFGDRGAATLASVMGVLSRQRSMMIGETDLKTIEERVGQTVPNGAAIAGHLYSLKSTIDEQKATIERLRNNLQQMGRGQHAISDSTVFVELGENLASRLQETAQSKDWTPESYIVEAVRLAIEGGWV